MKSCCLKSAKRDLKKHRDVATCDGCGFLLMAYGNAKDFEETLKALEVWGGEFSSIALDKLQVVAKARVLRHG